MEKSVRRDIVLATTMTAAVFLMLLVGSVAAAEHACVANDGTAFFCGSIVNKSCILNGTMNCPDTHGITVGEDNIVIDGNGFTIDGINNGNCPIIGGFEDLRSGINNSGYDNVTIKDIEVKNFCHGMQLKNCENSTIDNCTVHDNGNASYFTYGLVLRPRVCNSTITGCEIYNTTGYMIGFCEDGGAGIYLHTACNYNKIINNTLYGNRLSGIFSKACCKHNYVTHNDVHENGMYDTEELGLMTGGIRLMCIRTDSWIVEYNNVTDNYGPGIFVGGRYNIIKYNDIKGSKNTSSCGSGFGICMGRSDGGSYNNTLIENMVCNNEDTDISVVAESLINTGYNNTCDTTQYYNDEGAFGCTYRCSAAPDLVITDKSEEWIDLYNRTYNISYTIKNIGTVSAGESTTSISIDGTEVATDAVMVLAAGETFTNTLGPFSMSGIRDTIIICADSKANFTESEEGSNCCDNVFEYPGMPAEVHPPTSFLIWGFVFYDGAPDLNPTVTIKNINTSKEWHAESYANYNYYRVVLASGRDVNESEILRFNATSPEGSQSFNHIITLEDIFNGGLFNFNITPEPEVIFDTGEGTYPSISGTHNGTITPAQNTTVNRMYTYPCAGTGGHTEYVRIWDENGNVDGQGNWSGYPSDYHNVTISPAITLLQGHTYNYTIETGSYPQIVHAKSKSVTGGNITCTKFTDANGKTYTNWIPAIRLFYEGQ